MPPSTRRSSSWLVQPLLSSSLTLGRWFGRAERVPKRVCGLGSRRRCANNATCACRLCAFEATKVKVQTVPGEWDLSLLSSSVGAGGILYNIGCTTIWFAHSNSAAKTPPAERLALSFDRLCQWFVGWHAENRPAGGHLRVGILFPGSHLHVGHSPPHKRKIFLNTMTSLCMQALQGAYTVVGSSDSLHKYV